VRIKLAAVCNDYVNVRVLNRRPFFNAMVLVYKTKTSGLLIFCVALVGGKVKVGKYIMEAAGFSETSVHIYQMTNQRI
jgi:hypothetical protein